MSYVQAAWQVMCSGILGSPSESAKGKKLNSNQWEVYLIEFKFCEDTRPDPQLQKAQAQHSMISIANLNRQG